MRYFYLLWVLCLLSQDTYAGPTPAAVMKKVYQACSQIHEGSYVIHERLKGYTDSDTIQSIKEVYFLHSVNSNLVPFTAKIIDYTKATITWIDSSDRMLTYRSKDSSLKEISVGSEYRYLIFHYFDQTEARTNLELKNYLIPGSQIQLKTTDSSYILTYYTHPVNLFDANDTSESYHELHVDKLTYIPFKEISIMHWDSKAQYRESIIGEQDFSKIKRSILSPGTIALPVKMDMLSPSQPR